MVDIPKYMSLSYTLRTLIDLLRILHIFPHLLEDPLSLLTQIFRPYDILETRHKSTKNASISRY